MGENILPCKVLLRMLDKRFGVEFNFCLLVLGKNQVEEMWYIPEMPLMKGAGIGKMAAMLEPESESDCCIYLLGNRTSSKYSFLSRRWVPFDSPAQTNGCCIPATMLGKLYCFGVPGRPPMVYEDGWKDLESPVDLIDRKISFPVIPDPINNRFLVHFSDSAEIYAFHPKSDAAADTLWIRVVDYFNIRWSRTMAVSDNILFVHVFMLPSVVIAYDMSTNKWLEIVGDFARFNGTLPLYDDMFTLPDNHHALCLISVKRSCPAVVEILRLRFSRTIVSNHLTLTHLDYYTDAIPVPATVYDFLLI